MSARKRKRYKKNPITKNAHRKNNYARGRKNCQRAGKPWNFNELVSIIVSDRPRDRKLAEKIGRSVQAIQVMRTRLNNGVVSLAAG